MRIPENLVPESIKVRYRLRERGMIEDGYVYVVIGKGMYGLKQAGKLANEQLIEFLADHGYAPCPLTPGLWKHETRPINFTLVVDDFGVKYEREEDWFHLTGVLRLKYKISEDRSGSKYCGMKIDWDYQNGTVDISMPGYVERALQRFQHDYKGPPEHAPQPCTTPQYGARIQYAEDLDESPKLVAEQIKRIQEIIGVLLYYARAVDSTLLVALGTLASEQTKATEMTMRRVTHLLNYCATHPEATVRFKRSDMILHVESDASYLCLPKSTSRVAGYFYMGEKPQADNAQPPINGAVLVVCNILRVVVSSAAEAELAGVFYNAKETIAIRTMLEEMGHKQPPTPIITDNSTAAGIANDTVKQKQSKAMDMRFYWSRDKVKQGVITVTWRKGELNRADYFSKDHAAKHHQEMRPMYLHEAMLVETYEGEVKLVAEHFAMFTEDVEMHLYLFYATIKG